jgi:hypothetical protein
LNKTNVYVRPLGVYVPEPPSEAVPAGAVPQQAQHTTTTAALAIVRRAK